jgi:rSAM/selenodomain-associated transferase 1
MTARDKELLVIFSKNPVKGRVKTRLASAIGEEEALQVYETLRTHTEKIAAAVNAPRHIFYSDVIPENDILLSGGAPGYLQEGRDLGERMHRAFLHGFSEGFGLIVLIGTDCLELTTVLIEEAFRCLAGEEVVIGPARDGGYYLIGLKRAFPELFLDREWSTPNVLYNTIRTLREHGTGHMLLPALSDIDTIDDLKKSMLWKRSP